VKSEVEKRFMIRNTGPYAISYKAVLQDKASTFFTVEPTADEIAPQSQKEVTVVFNKGQQVLKELKLTNNTSSIQILISEPITQTMELPLPVKVRTIKGYAFS
jgi:hypothetical protein